LAKRNFTILEQNRKLWRLVKNTKIAKFLSFLLEKTDLRLEYLTPSNHPRVNLAREETLVTFGRTELRFPLEGGFEQPKDGNINDLVICAIAMFRQ